MVFWPKIHPNVRYHDFYKNFKIYKMCYIKQKYKNVLYKAEYKNMLYKAEYKNVLLTTE